ncbi:AEC family transporter [Rickettsia endosymbiont of Cardiosporidium cionae]|nr:AEC family transporter [Rickettsia endosymbiont of Cardiosporidium cionae]
MSSLLNVLIGYCAGKFYNVEKESIASLLFFFIAPIVFFTIPSSVSLKLNDLSIILITFSICSIIGVSSFFFYGKIWQDEHRSILALSAGTGNSGYVVLPIASELFNSYTLSIYTFGLIGIALYEASIGYYFCVRNFSSIKDSLIRVLKLPILNAFFIGCTFSILGIRLPDFLSEFSKNMKGAFSILGMIMIGLALSRLSKFVLDIKFVIAAFSSKFIVFPLVFGVVIMLDKYIFGIYGNDYYNALHLLSISPMATNIIVISSIYKLFPEKVASTILLSLLFALIYMPIMSHYILII